MDDKLKLFSLSANEPLAQKIANKLGTTLAKCSIKKFADGEVIVDIAESVRGKNCYVIQPTSPPNVNEAIMELLVMIDALKRADAKTICAVLPYYGYARQDRKSKPRQPITSKLVATLMETAGATRFMSMDLHASQIQGFFSVHFDEFYALPIISKYFSEKDISNLCVVSPDHGGAVRAKKMSEYLDCPIAIIDKRRPAPNVSEVTGIIGEVEGKNCVVIDDMIDTGGSIVNAVGELKKKGAKKVYVACTHAVFSGPAVDRLSNAEIEEVVVTDTIHLNEEKIFDNLKIISVANLFADGIKAVYNKKSIGDVFEKYEKEINLK